MDRFEKALIQKLFRTDSPIWQANRIYYDANGSIDVAVNIIPFLGYRFFTEKPIGWLALCEVLQQQKIQFISYHGIIGVNCSEITFQRLQDALSNYLDVQSFAYPATDPMAGPLAAEILSLWGYNIISLNPLACGYVFYRPVTISVANGMPQLLLEQS